MQERVEVPLLVRLLGLPRGGHILEIGCGRGIALPPILRLLHPERLVGLDVDRSALEHASAHLQACAVSAELHQGDVRALPFAAASFDLVIDFGTCHHIRAPALALREIVRVLRPGGLLVCETVSSQILSHPIRTRGRRLPWAVVPELQVVREGVLWKARMKVPVAAGPRCTTWIVGKNA
jgi:ubiquinone/menaquinone biosynthesis C-methylase UbiE